MTNRTVSNPARPIAWVILVIGIIAVIVAAIHYFGNLGETFLTFSITQIFWMGVLFAIVGIILLLVLRPIELPAAEVPTVRSMAVPPGNRPTPAPPVDAPVRAVPPATAPVRAAPPAATKPDDLTILEGVGPKIAAALVAAGIDTFAKLARTSETDLRAAMDKAELRFVPSLPTWAKQADLIAKGDVQGFEAYRNSLTAGRE